MAGKVILLPNPCASITAAIDLAEPEVPSAISQPCRL